MVLCVVSQQVAREVTHNGTWSTTPCTVPGRSDLACITLPSSYTGCKVSLALSQTHHHMLHETNPGHYSINSAAINGAFGWTSVLTNWETDWIVVTCDCYCELWTPTLTLHMHSATCTHVVHYSVSVSTCGTLVLAVLPLLCRRHSLYLQLGS